MADLFASLKPTKQVSRNGFDLSQKHVFSMRAGQVTPVACVETVPNDYFTIDLMAFHRSNTLDSAAFMRGKFTYDAYFVPYSQLWHPFNQFISRREDKHTANQKGFYAAPNVSLGDLLGLIWLLNRGEISTEQLDDVNGTMFGLHGEDVCYNMLRTLDMLGYGDHFAILDLEWDVDGVRQIGEYQRRFKNVYVNVFRAAALKHIWYDVYRNKYYDVDSVDTFFDTSFVETFNFDDIECTSFANSHLYVPQINLMEQSHLQCSQQDEYALGRLVGLFNINYVQWKKDLFTSAMPGQQFGAVSTAPLNLVSLSASIDTGSDRGMWSYLDSSIDFVDSESVRVYGNNNKNSNLVTDVDELEHTHTFDGRRVADFLNRGGSYLNVLELKKAEMMQVWKQATLRAGNMVSDNFKAHFGVEPNYSSDEQVRYLGSWEAQFNINAIESTASTGAEMNGAVGDIAATGSAAVQGGKIEFKCNDFGVLCVVCYFRPEADYRSTMLDKANTLMNEFDFFTPEFQDLGLEAIPMSQYDLTAFGNINSVMGYAPRYFHHKTALDKIHHGFFDSLLYYNGVNEDYSVENKGYFNSWAAPRIEDLWTSDSGAIFRNKASFYVNPAVLDSIFGVESDSKPNTDQFICNCFLDIKAVRPMSVLGMPQF